MLGAWRGQAHSVMVSTWAMTTAEHVASSDVRYRCSRHASDSHTCHMSWPICTVAVICEPATARFSSAEMFCEIVRWMASCIRLHSAHVKSLPDTPVTVTFAPREAGSSARTTAP